MKSWLLTNESLIASILTDLDTPIALSVLIELRYREWDSLAVRWLDPSHYPEGIFSALKFLKDMQAVDLLRKAPLPTSFDRRLAAHAAWESAETQCYITNEYLVRSRGHSHICEEGPTFRKFLSEAQKRLGRWLGPLPDVLDGGFGPGTCVEYQASNPTVVDKIWLTPTTTPACRDLFAWHYGNTLWGARRWEGRLGAPGLSRGNRLTTVPKDGKTDRPISIEPVGNLWLQLGIGRHLKRRLSLIGLPDYRPASRELFPGYEVRGTDAQAVHRSFIFRCRREGYSTIDLSSASDTLALELVRELLPPDWFSLLDDCRSKMTWVPSQAGGAWRHLEKFSSMGNGFTFELESLVFCVLLSVAFGLTPGRDLWVFGDDIILPSRHFDSACSLLEKVGFTPNRRKSFKSGPFFESCGGNCHTDVDVTPLRIKGPLENPTEIYAFHNALYRRGFSRKTLRKVRDLLPRNLQFPGPSRLGDVVLHGLPYGGVVRHSISWLRTLKALPSLHIPLERWDERLAVVALLLGSGTRVVRRSTPMNYRSGLASIS